MTYRSSSALYGAILVTGLLAGLLVAAASWQMSALGIFLLVGVLMLALARSALRPVAFPTSTFDAESVPQALRMRVPRAFYYLGAATIGFLTVRPALAFTASDWIFLLSFGATCLVLVTHGVDREFVIPRTITYGVIVFAIGGFASSVHAIDQVQSVSIVVRLLYLTIVWFWLGSIVLQTRKHVEYALLAWVVSAALSSAGAVAQFLFGNVVPGGDVAWGRMTGFTQQYNVLGGLAATAFVPALMLAVESRRLWIRALGFASVGLLSAGLLLSGSVGGMFAAAVATIFWLTVRGITRQVVIGMAGVILAGYLLMSATGSTSAPNPIERISRVTSEKQAAAGTGGSVYTRLDGYRLAWRSIEGHPFVGVGLDDASSKALFGDELVHNMFLSPWATAGLLGLAGILLMVGGAAALGCTAVQRASPEERGFNTALLSSIVAFVVFGMGEPILFVRYGWFPVALLVALRAQQHRAETPATRPLPFAHTANRSSLPA